MNKVVKQEQIDLSMISEIISRHRPFSQEDIITSLQEAQDHYGYLPREVIDELARMTGIPIAKIYGVATFYTQFHFRPHGKYTVRLCRGTACHVKGAPKILSTVSRYLGIKDGETTNDMLFSLESVACLGTCFLSPAMLIENQYYGKLTPESTIKILENIARENEKK